MKNKIELPKGKTLFKWDYPQQGHDLSGGSVRRFTHGDLGYVESTFSDNGKPKAMFVRLEDGKVTEIKIDELIAVKPET